MKRIRCMGAMLTLWACMAGAQAQHTTIVVPAGAGGQGDTITRYYADRLQTRLGESVIVDNKPGASGSIAASMVARAPADGRTLFMAMGGGPLTIMPFLRERMPYDPAKDLVPVAMVADLAMAIAVRQDSPYQTIGDLLQDARQRPGQLSVANTGVGSISHLLGELLGQSTGTSFLHVPFQGITSAFTEVLGGRVDAFTSTSVALEELVKAGKLRVLATFSQNPLPSAAGAPTVAQALKVDGLAVPLWFGFFAPAKTPAAKVSALAAAVLDICRQPETQQQFKEIVACAGPADFARAVEQDRERWRETIRKANIKTQ
ncbi:tripartite tricarboxylate transporter substrate binding protein [Hydrogenophaga sp.]|uniref:Bug family tripartite tricarboxylate transporter substrate binding protein n=1 Tax=Hydrogenophaga sp. TaxID=1904254 RepID=UPI002622968A|nr:tripartite tricarboxylate transporter substrate binding protein [Hydrogenophaga sp.]MCW5655132.1 tripartite tricarboxylate transporter substrate binding protein [Hydrogenophaga sp.]